MPSLKDEIEECISQTGPKCAVMLLMESMDPHQVVELNQLMAQDQYPHTAFSRWALKHRKKKISGDTFGRHRKRECACGNR